MTEKNQDLVVQKEKFSVAIQNPKIQDLINRTLGDQKRALNFIASISSMVAVNPALQECEPFTVINGALMGESLKLVPSPQLGRFFLVPFNDKERGKVATFILGYKGYVELAIRTGQYAYIDVMEIHEGEYLGRNQFNGRPMFEFFSDDAKRIELPVVGYMACFELIGGFKKTLYWSLEAMIKHADTYSAAFNAKSYELLKAGKIPQNEMWKYSSFWYKNFDGQAMKTMLRQLISKWGVMSIELQNAFESDETFMDESGKPAFPAKDPINPGNVIPTVGKEVDDKAGTVPIPTDSKSNPEPEKPHDVAQPKPGIVVDEKTGEVKPAVTDAEAAAKLAAMGDGDTVVVKKNF